MFMIVYDLQTLKHVTSCIGLLYCGFVLLMMVLVTVVVLDNVIDAWVLIVLLLLVVVPPVVVPVIVADVATDGLPNCINNNNN